MKRDESVPALAQKLAAKVRSITISIEGEDKSLLVVSRLVPNATAAKIFAILAELDEKT